MVLRALFVSLAVLFASCAMAQDAPPSPYVAAGVPAPSREWSGADYARTLQVLSAGSVPLPRFADPHGAALLRRIAALDNFAFHRNKSLPLNARLTDFLTLYRSVNDINKLYLAKTVNDAATDRPELSSLLAFLLRSTAVGLDLVEELLPTLPKDETYGERMKGLQQVRSGLTTMFVGAEMSLGEGDFFSSRDRSAILEAMAATIPSAKRFMAPDVRRELQRKLKADRARFNNANDVRHLDTLDRELNG